MALFGRKNESWQPPTANDVKQRWRDCVDDMLALRRNYLVNNAYLHDDQWIGWDDNTASVNVLPFQDEDDSKYRATVNKLKPHTIAMVARLCRTPLGFEPRPSGVDAGALRKSRIERQVLEAKHHRDDWEALRTAEVLACTLGGVSAVCVEPDWEYGETPVADIHTGDMVYLPQRPKVKLTALTPLEFGLEPGTRTASDASWWIRMTTLTPGQARRRYPELKADPTPDADAVAAPMHRQLMSARSAGATRGRKACAVFVYYERPSRTTPGCVVHVIGDQVVEQTEWPFSFKDRLNLRPFVNIPVDGTWQGDTMFNSARSLQRTYNLVQTSINKHIGKADNARILMPTGAMIEGEDEFTGEAAEVVRYDPSVGAAPSWMQPPQMPRWLREQKDDCEAALADLFSRHSVSAGIAPGDRNSGTALAILAEKDETPLGLFVADQQRGWQALAEMVLMTERHLMSLADAELGENGPMKVAEVLPGDRGWEQPVEVVYRSQDLSEHPTVHVPIESVMPRSQVAVVDQIVRLAQTFPQAFQQFSPAQLAAMAQVPDQAAFGVIADPQEALAEWENGRMLVGADDTEVSVEDWHDHELHVARHNAARASGSYREASQQVKSYIDSHIEAHVRIAHDLQQQQMLQQLQQQAMAAFAGAPQLALPPGDDSTSAGSAGVATDEQGVPA